LKEVFELLGENVNTDELQSKAPLQSCNVWISDDKNSELEIKRPDNVQRLRGLLLQNRLIKSVVTVAIKDGFLI